MKGMVKEAGMETILTVIQIRDDGNPAANSRNCTKSSNVLQREVGQTLCDQYISNIFLDVQVCKFQS